MTDNPLRSLPSVNDVLKREGMVSLVGAHGQDVVTYAVRSAVDRARHAVRGGAEPPSEETIAADAADIVEGICRPSPVPVINATGVVLHTNLGRAPLGEVVTDEIVRVVRGYSNLEFDLQEGLRGHRMSHVRDLLRYLTGAEDALVVNNNAAGILLLLSTLAAGRGVVVSRGELVEIGGSFRVPEIMAAGGARMVEVGTTNRTHLADYEAAIDDDTAILLKVHKSNYAISGFTNEVSVKEVAELAHRRGLLMVYDIGSGLLRKIPGLGLENEPDVHGALADGADLVTFSGDKLLGGPQAGVVVGRADLVERLAKAPMMRALRVGKLTFAALSAACRGYVAGRGVTASNPAMLMLTRTGEELSRLASLLVEELERRGVSARVEESHGQAGGGSSPEVRLRSVAVEVVPQGDTGTRKLTFAERLHAALRQGEPAVLGVLREGRLLFDVLTLFDDQIVPLAQAVADACGARKDA